MAVSLASMLAIFSVAKAPVCDFGVGNDAKRLARKMGLLHGGRWKAVVDHQSGFILIKPDPGPKPTE
jgi:hypothetical protein